MNDTSIALFAGAIACAIVQPAPAASPITKQRVIYSFGNNQKDAVAPVGGLLAMDGLLYGTTFSGGGGCTGNGCGAVFSVDPRTGKEKLLHAFNGDDGEYSYSTLIALSGMLYGTTAVGGDFYGGTVFALDPKTGAINVLYSFCSFALCQDGQGPGAGLIEVNGTLYGTTVQGGLEAWGAVFALDPDTGAERVVYSFCSQADCADGRLPAAGLVELNGTLYGTTQTGGANDEGTVFSLDPGTGTEKVLHSFGGAKDGSEPVADLIVVNGMLFGTTQGGGASHDKGTVFSIDPGTGKEKVVHSFRGHAEDGRRPLGKLVDFKNTLYGTTSRGGTADLGTVFALDPDSGAENVVYSFCASGSSIPHHPGGAGCTDGARPWAELVPVNGKLFGTTSAGGTHNGLGGCGNEGCGTVFVVKP